MNHKISIALFFFGAIIFWPILFGLNQLAEFRWLIFDSGYGEIAAKTKLIENSYRQEKNILLGGSRLAASYHPNNSSYTINLGISGSTPLNAYFILKRLLNNSTKINKLVISFTPIYFEKENYFFRDLTQFYSPDEVNSLSQFMSKDSIFGETKGSIYSCLIRTPFCYQPYYSILQKQPFTFVLSLRTYRQVVSDLGWHKSTVNTPNNKPSEYRIRHDVFKPDYIIDKYFSYLLELAKKNNIEVFFYIAPIEEENYKEIKNSNYMKSFYSYINSKSNIMKIIDGGGVPLTFMSDGDHVNSLGSDYVTDYLNKHILARGD